MATVNIKLTSIPDSLKGSDRADDRKAVADRLKLDLAAASGFEVESVVIDQSGALLSIVVGSDGDKKLLDSRVGTVGTPERMLVLEAGLGLEEGETRPTPAPAGGVDVAILTALQKVEFYWVKRTIELLHPGVKWVRAPSPYRRICEICELPVGDAAVRCVVSSAGSMGMSAMATLATRVGVEFSPSFMFLCGISAAIPGKGFDLGDVAVFESAVDHDLGKLTTDEDTGEPRFLWNNEQLMPYGNANTILEDFCHENTTAMARGAVREYLSQFLEVASEKPNWELKMDRAHASTVNFVVDNKGVLDTVIDRDGRFVGVLEMEAAGFYRACKELGIPGLVVKGISDMARNKSSDNLRSFAAYASAMTVATYLSSGSELLKLIKAGRSENRDTP